MIAPLLCLVITHPLSIVDPHLPITPLSVMAPLFLKVITPLSVMASWQMTL